MVIRRPVIKLKKKGEEVFATPEEKRRVEEVRRKREEPEKEPERQEEPSVEREPIRPTIQAKPEQTFLQKAAQAQLEILTSPKTTAVLATVLAAELAFGAIVTPAAGGTAIITRTATQIRAGGATATTQRAFTGKAATSGIDKIFHAVRPVAARFASNAKSTAITKGMFAKLGLTTGAIGTLVAAIGSYPFAGFIKEEALQTLGFAFNTAEKNDDLEGMQLAINETEEILNAAPSILDKIPFANVLNQLKTFFEAARTKLNNDKRVLALKTAEAQRIEEQGESDFARERRESDIAAFERKREFAKEETERFEDIEEERQDRRDKEIQEDEDRFKKIAEEATQKDLDELNFKERYFELIREKRFNDAKRLLDEFEAKVKGGK